MTRLAYKITDETDVNWGKAAEKENYSEWKVDFLLWRGAKPYYTVGTDECYGAASIAMLWLQPKLLNHLTENISKEDKRELMVKCSDLFSVPSGSDKINEIKDILGLNKKRR